MSRNYAVFYRSGVDDAVVIVQPGDSIAVLSRGECCLIGCIPGNCNNFWCPARECVSVFGRRCFCSVCMSRNNAVLYRGGVDDAVVIVQPGDGIAVDRPVGSKSDVAGAVGCDLLDLRFTFEPSVEGVSFLYRVSKGHLDARIVSCGVGVGRVLCSLVCNCEIITRIYEGIVAEAASRDVYITGRGIVIEAFSRCQGAVRCGCHGCSVMISLDRSGGQSDRKSLLEQYDDGDGVVSLYALDTYVVSLALLGDIKSDVFGEIVVRNEYRQSRDVVYYYLILN